MSEARPGGSKGKENYEEATSKEKNMVQDVTDLNGGVYRLVPPL